MPVEAPVAPAPVVDLPVRTDIDSAPVSGSLKEMLAIAKLSKSEETPTDPAPAPAPAPDPAPAPTETPEERIAKAEATLRQKLFQHKKGKAKEPESPTPDPEPTPTPDPEPAPSPAPAKVPTRKAVVKDPATEYAERLEKLEQQRLELERQKLELERQRQNPPSPQPQHQPEALKLLSDEERYEYDVFGQMDKLEAGKDYQKRFLKSVEATAAYKSKWEKENAGEVFDPNDSAHDDFFAKNGFKYDKGAFRRAEAKLANSDTPQQDANTQRELRELKLKASLNELQPRVMKTAAVTIQAMLNAIDPDIAKAVEAGGPQELMKQFPARGKRVMLAASAVKNFADEAFRLLETDGLVDPDGDRNPIHRLILNIIAKQEPLIKAQPLVDQSLEDGRRFATWEQWAAMTPAQRAEHWHLGAEEVVDIFSQTQAAQIKEEIGEIDKEIEARSARKAPAPAPAAPQPAPAPRPSPTVSSRSVIDTTNNRPPDNTPPLDKKLRSILFNRPS